MRVCVCMQGAGQVCLEPESNLIHTQTRFTSCGSGSKLDPIGLGQGEYLWICRVQGGFALTLNLNPTLSTPKLVSHLARRVQNSIPQSWGEVSTCGQVISAIPSLGTRLQTKSKFSISFYHQLLSYLFSFVLSVSSFLLGRNLAGIVLEM